MHRSMQKQLLAGLPHTASRANAFLCHKKKTPPAVILGRFCMCAQGWQSGKSHGIYHQSGSPDSDRNTIEGLHGIGSTSENDRYRTQ